MTVPCQPLLQTLVLPSTAPSGCSIHRPELPPVTQLPAPSCLSAITTQGSVRAQAAAASLVHSGSRLCQGRLQQINMNKWAQGQGQRAPAQ